MTLPQKLNDIEFDHPFRIEADGSIEDVYPQVYPPSVYHDEESDVHIDGEGWSAFSFGYSGQWGYSGPVMHASEYIGGRLERDMLDEPGVYVVTVVTTDEEDVDAGWIVLKRDKDEIVADKFRVYGQDVEYTVEVPSQYDPAPEWEQPIRIGVSALAGGDVGIAYAHQTWLWGVWFGGVLFLSGEDLRTNAVGATHAEMARTLARFLSADAETLARGGTVENTTYRQRQREFLEGEGERLGMFGLGLE